MNTVVFLLSSYFILVQNVSSLKEFMKPSFVPYCTTRNRCQPVCICDVQPECEVLELDNNTRESILSYHNQIREIQTKAEPQPGGMTMLKYDIQLEEISECWAARCEDEYSECFLTSTYPDTSMLVNQTKLENGQTVSAILWIEVINYWLKNTKYLSVETLSSLPAGKEGEMLRNYAQILSDQVLAVGCAWSQNKDSLTMVCTYGPRGPLQGESIYKTGQPCSLCPNNYECDFQKPFDNLCKRVVQTTLAPFETPPRPPPTPPSRKKHKSWRSHRRPPRFMYEKLRLQSQSVLEEIPQDVDYYDTRKPPSVIDPIADDWRIQDNDIEEKYHQTSPNTADFLTEQMLPLIPYIQQYDDDYLGYPAIPAPPEESIAIHSPSSLLLGSHISNGGNSSDILVTTVETPAISSSEPSEIMKAIDTEDRSVNWKTKKRHEELPYERSCSTSFLFANFFIHFLINYLFICLKSIM